jgi:Domain of unknown function (DUF1844)
VSEPKQEETFKVIDRRHFTEQGEVRPEAAELDRQEQEAAAKRAASQPAPKPQPAAATKSASEPATATAAAGPTLVPSPQEAPAADDLAESETEPSEPMSASSRSFQMLIDFLARNAAAMLGGMADPRTGQPFVDLEGAREMIDMIDALKEKTAGNLNKDDESLLAEVLGSLKLTYMEIQRAAAEAMMKKAKVKP